MVAGPGFAGLVVSNDRVMFDRTLTTFGFGAAVPICRIGLTESNLSSSSTSTSRSSLLSPFPTFPPPLATLFLIVLLSLNPFNSSAFPLTADRLPSIVLKIALASDRACEKCGVDRPNARRLDVIVLGGVFEVEMDLEVGVEGGPSATEIREGRN